MPHSLHNVSLREFQFNLARCPCPATLICGKRFSGKTRIAATIADRLKCDRWIAFCGSEEARFEWARRFGSAATVYDWDAKGREVFATVMKEQRQLARQAKYENRELHRSEMVGMIFDDLTTNKDFSHSPELKILTGKGRHWGAIPIVIAQYLRSMGPTDRGNFDIVIQMRCFRESIELLFKAYGMYMDLRRYEKLYHHIINFSTPDGKPLYYGMVIDGVENARDIHEYYKVIRADDNDQLIQLGSQEWREYNKKNFVDVEELEFKREQKKKIRAAKRLARNQQNHYTSWDNDDLSIIGSDDEDEKLTTDEFINIPSPVKPLILPSKRGQGPDLQIHMPSRISPSSKQNYPQPNQYSYADHKTRDVYSPNPYDNNHYNNNHYNNPYPNHPYYNNNQNKFTYESASPWQAQQEYMRQRARY